MCTSVVPACSGFNELFWCKCLPFYHFEMQVKIFNCVRTIARFSLSANTFPQLEFHLLIHHNFEIVLQLKHILFYNWNVWGGVVVVLPTGEVKFLLYKGRFTAGRGEFSGEVPLWFYEKLEDLKKNYENVHVQVKLQNLYYIHCNILIFREC